MKIHTVKSEMGFVGACDYIVVHSGSTYEQYPCLVKVFAKVPLAFDDYVQVVPMKDIFEIFCTHLDYPVNPRIVAVGDEASKKLGKVIHEKIHINNWRVM